jgi:Uma2 family endonuclease
MATIALMTAEELLALPDDDKRHELVRGELVAMAPPGFGHGRDTVALAVRLDAAAQAAGTGIVVGEAGFRLTHDPDTVRAPDVAFVSANRLPAPEAAHRYFEGAPDLAVEIVSPGDTWSDVFEKVQEYLAAGSRLVWVVERRTRTVSVYRDDGSSQVLRADDTLSGEDVLPGFSLALRDLYS